VPDAIVIGSGPNGLLAANVLAGRGWEVLVLEAAAEPGGGVRSAELTEPGFVHDVFSAFYPFAVASPAFRALGLEAHGLRWRHGDYAVAHPASDGTCAVLSPRLEETMASLEAFAPGDGEAWARLYGLWERVGEHLVEPALGLAGRQQAVPPREAVDAGEQGAVLDRGRHHRLGDDHDLVGAHCGCARKAGASCGDRLSSGVGAAGGGVTTWSPGRGVSGTTGGVVPR